MCVGFGALCVGLGVLCVGFGALCVGFGVLCVGFGAAAKKTSFWGEERLGKALPSLSARLGIFFVERVRRRMYDELSEVKPYLEY